MKALRFLLLSLTVVSASLVPQVPSQASELVKLGRLLVTGKRAPVAPVPPTVVSEELKPAAAPAIRPSVESAERSSTAPRAQEVLQEAREGTGTPSATDRPAAMEPKSLDRGSVSGGGSVSASSERGPLIGFSLRNLLRGV